MLETIRKQVRTPVEIGRWDRTYCCTTVNRCARTAASSLTRCGRFPVARSCAITASTMVSLMASPSFFLAAFRAVPSPGGGDASGDGGGVCSCFILVAGGGLVASASASCGRFSLFTWAYSAGDGDSGVVEERPADREGCVPGTWIPREGSESDFRLVLYGIVDDDVMVVVDSGLGSFYSRVAWRDVCCVGTRAIRSDADGLDSPPLMMPTQGRSWNAGIRDEERDETRTGNCLLS